MDLNANSSTPFALPLSRRAKKGIIFIEKLLIFKNREAL
jgi:hypothetical protein